MEQQIVQHTKCIVLPKEQVKHIDRIVAKMRQDVIEKLEKPGYADEGDVVIKADGDQVLISSQGGQDIVAILDKAYPKEPVHTDPYGNKLQKSHDRYMNREERRAAARRKRRG